MLMHFTVFSLNFYDHISHNTFLKTECYLQRLIIETMWYCMKEIRANELWSLAPRKNILRKGVNSDVTRHRLNRSGHPARVYFTFLKHLGKSNLIELIVCYLRKMSKLFLICKYLFDFFFF